VVAKLPHKGMHPDYLVTTITEHHIFGFGGGECNCSLSSQHPQMAPPTNFRKYPDCDFQLDGSEAQSESVQAISP
jgi:hypothetical protein